MKNTIFSKILQLKQRISNAEYYFGRKPGSVQLVAMSKAQTLESVKLAMAAGQLVFGESYVQEAAKKIRELQDVSILRMAFYRKAANK